MYLSCYFAGEDTSENEAAVQIYGIYDSMREAQEAVRGFADSEKEVGAFVLDQCNRWLAVRTPDAGCSAEEEEIAHSDNLDRANGRMGSVCDVRKPSVPADAANPSPSPSPSPFVGTADPTPVKTSQRQQLDDLLTECPFIVPLNAHTYNNCRHRLALLRAFERKLTSLIEQSEQKCLKGTDEVRHLDTLYPDYQTRYSENYKHALKQSGIREDTVGLMQYLERLS